MGLGNEKIRELGTALALFYEVLSASPYLDPDAREMLYTIWIAAIEYQAGG